MNWLAILFAFEVGMVPINMWTVEEQAIQNRPHYYTQFEVEAEAFNTFFVGGEIKTRMYAIDDDYMFSPFTDEYMFNTGFRVGIVEAGFRHMCTHPVVPYIKTNGIRVDYEGGYEEIYLRVEVKR